MSRTLLLHSLLDEGTFMPGEVGYTFFTCHTCLTIFCGCFLGCLFLVYLCMSNPLNGHLIVCPWMWKLICLDHMCKTTFVVFRNGLPRRRGTSLLWPMSRMTKSIRMYVSQIFTKISLANPSGFHKDWFAICSWKCAVDKGPPNILSYTTLDMTLMLAPRSQKALWKTCGPIEHVIVWQNPLNNMAHMHLSLPQRSLTAMHVYHRT
jgi:hypothetical protein